MGYSKQILHALSSLILCMLACFRGPLTCQFSKSQLLQSPFLVSRIRDVLYLLSSFRFPPHYVPRFRSWRSSSKAVHETEDGIQQAQHFITYSKFAFEHMTIRHNLESHLGSVLLMFPKITTITLTNTFTTQTSSFKYALQTDTIARLWVRIPQFLSIIRAISNYSQSNITKLGTEGRMVETRWKSLSNSDFGDDSNMLGSAKNCIRDFETGTYLSESMPTIVSSAFDMCPADLSITRSIFHNLTHLNLALSSTTEPAGGFDIGRPTGPLEPCWAGLSRVLSALVNVSDLSLDFKVRRAIDQQLTWWYFEDDLEEIFEGPKLTFPHLKTLSLVRFRSTAKSLASLLRRHSAIANLKLHHVIQTSDDDNSAFVPWSSSPPAAWVQVAELMRGMRLLRLDLRDVEGFRNDYTLPGREFVDLLYPRLHDYILHGYGANPLIHGRLNDEWDMELWGEQEVSMRASENHNVQIPRFV